MQSHSTRRNGIFAREGVVFSQTHEDMAQIADQLVQRGAHTLLDPGCGTGRHTLYFAQRGFTAHGIDSASSGLSTTRQRLDQAGLSAQLIQHDIFEGLLYHYFTPEELHNLFSSFLVVDFHLDRERHYCLTAARQ